MLLVVLLASFVEVTHKLLAIPKSNNIILSNIILSQKAYSLDARTWSEFYLLMTYRCFFPWYKTTGHCYGLTIMTPGLKRNLICYGELILQS